MTVLSHDKGKEYRVQRAYIKKAKRSAESAHQESEVECRERTSRRKERGREKIKPISGQKTGKSQKGQNQQTKLFENQTENKAQPENLTKMITSGKAKMKDRTDKSKEYNEG